MRVSKPIINKSSVDLMADRVGLDGYIPYGLVDVCLTFAKHKLLAATPTLDNDMKHSLWELISDSRIELWLEDTMRLVKYLGDRYNLRLIEEALYKGEGVIDDIPKSFNYKFDLSKVSEHTKNLLGITVAHIDEAEKLPKEVIEILTIASGYGSFIKTSKTTDVSNEYMNSYSQIINIPKHEYSYPWFDYKMTVKAFDVKSEKIVNVKSDKLVVGYFLDTFSKSPTIKSILKLIGAIILQYDHINVTLYSFYGNRSTKYELTSKDDIVSHFSKKPQLKLFPINNSKALQQMMFENKGSEVVFIPNINDDCVISPSMYNGTKINIMSFDKSKYNPKYSSLCNKTGGIFITI